VLGNPDRPGKNPRALKRLTNSLSLIKIFNELDAKRESYNNEQYEKLINIGLICCQITYPFIYRLLNSEPDFKKWNEKTATRHKLKALEEEQIEILEQSEEFDEEWEQVKKYIKRSYDLGIKGVTLRT
jgi:hypothetical protein